MVQDSRHPPLRGSPGYMSRMYRSNMRPVVLVGAFFAILWSLAAAVSAFRNVPLFNSNHDTHLALFYIIMGGLYAGVMAIEIFGIFASLTRRLALVRIFAYLSILVILLIAAAGTILTIVHFSFKNDILNTCSNVNTGDHIYFTGFFGPVDGGVVTQQEAQEWCSHEFDHDSFSHIVALLATTVIAAVFSVFIFSYFRQLQDPTSIINVSREPVRMDAYPARYNPPYNPQSYNPVFQYQPPAGPPNTNTDAFVPPYEGADTKPPNYEGGGYQGEFGDRKDDPFWDGHRGRDEENRPR